MAAILKFKMAAIILDESRVSRDFLKSSDLLDNCAKATLLSHFQQFYPYPPDYCEFYTAAFMFSKRDL